MQLPRLPESSDKVRKAHLELNQFLEAMSIEPSVTGLRAMSCFRFGPDGNSVVCGFDDGKLEVVDLRKSTEVMTVIDAHQGPIWSVDCSRGNGNLIATGRPRRI